MLGTPTEVSAYTGCLAHERIEVEDTAVAVLRFQSGALGVIHATTAAYPGLDASLRVFGSKGSAVICDDALVYFHENVGPAPEIAFPDPGRAAGSCRRCCAPWPAMVAVHRAQKRRRDGVVAAQGQPLGRAPASRRRAHAGRTSCAAPLLGVNSFVLTAAAHGSTCGRRH